MRHYTDMDKPTFDSQRDTPRDEPDGDEEQDFLLDAADFALDGKDDDFMPEFVDMIDPNILGEILQHHLYLIAQGEQMEACAQLREAIRPYAERYAERLWEQEGEA